MFRSFEESEPVLNTLTPGGKIYLPEHSRFLLGIEEMHIQGVPMPWLRLAFESNILTETQAKQFAGNAYTATVVAAVFLALFRHWPFPKMGYHEVPALPSIDSFLL